VVGDVSLGIEKAEKHGFALVQANSYLLDDFKKFHKVMEEEGVEPRGLPQLNSGVVFFSTRHNYVGKVLAEWRRLCKQYSGLDWTWSGDQPYLNLALELHGVVPYTLTRNYNYRPKRDPVFGPVKVWHSNSPPPENLNVQRNNWRRYDAKGKTMVSVLDDRSLRLKLAKMLREFRRCLVGQGKAIES